MADSLWNGVGISKGSSIQPRGGGRIWFMQSQQDGTPLSPTPDTFHLGPYIAEIEGSDKSPWDKYKTDDAETLVLGGIREVMVPWKTYQRNIEIYKSTIFSTNDSQFWTVLYQLSDRKINGAFQYILWAACQFEPISDWKHFGNDFAFNLWSNKIPASVTYSTFTGVTTALSTTFPVGASITVDPNDSSGGGGYYQYYTSLS